jgi:hypothetical protein
VGVATYAPLAVTPRLYSVQPATDIDGRRRRPVDDRNPRSSGCCQPRVQLPDLAWTAAGTFDAPKGKWRCSKCLPTATHSVSRGQVLATR